MTEKWRIFFNTVATAKWPETRNKDLKKKDSYGRVYYNILQVLVTPLCTVFDGVSVYGVKWTYKSRETITESSDTFW